MTLRVPGKTDATRCGRGLAVLSLALLLSTSCARPAVNAAVGTSVPPLSSSSIAAGSSVAIASSSTATGPTTVSSASGAVGGTSVPLPQCSPGKLPTSTPGTLTFATAATTHTPWFTGNDPANGQGLESALAYAVAERLGYAKSAVVWVREDPAAIESGSATGFDAALDEFVAAETPGSTVDYTTGYFAINDVVVVSKTNTVVPAKAATAAGLATLKVGVSAGSTAVDGVQGFSPSERVTSFSSTAAVLAALRSHRIEAAAIDAPTALAATDLTVVGQLPAGQWQPAQLGMVLAKGSKLTGCLSAAIDSLRVEGKLADLSSQWVSIPTLRQ